MNAVVSTEQAVWRQKWQGRLVEPNVNACKWIVWLSQDVKMEGDVMVPVSDWHLCGTTQFPTMRTLPLMVWLFTVLFPTVTQGTLTLHVWHCMCASLVVLIHDLLSHHGNWLWALFSACCRQENPWDMAHCCASQKERETESFPLDPDCLTKVAGEWWGKQETHLWQEMQIQIPSTWRTLSVVHWRGETSGPQKTSRKDTHMVSLMPPPSWSAQNNGNWLLWKTVKQDVECTIWTFF